MDNSKLSINTFSFNSHTNLRSRCYCTYYFINEENKAQKKCKRSLGSGGGQIQTWAV